MARDLYGVLGVAKDATGDAIKKAFRKLAVQFHPDKNPGKGSEEKFKEINRAHEILADKDKRALYDEFGDESLQQGFDAERARMMKNFARQRRGRGAPQGGGDFQDIFSSGGFQGNPGGAQGVDLGDMFGDFFARGRGGGGGGRARAPAKAPDQEAVVTIGFIDSLKGTTVSFTSGESDKPVTVRIPAGVSDGGRVKVEGQGAQIPGAQPGDLYIRVKVDEHPFLKREGDNLHLEIPITIVEAFEGAKIRVPTLEGHVTLKVPPRTQTGQVLRLRGKGVERKGRPTGDLYVRFLVRVPEGDDPALVQAIEALKPFTTDPRAGIEI